MCNKINIDNYTVFHLHSDLSNGVTNIDSVTKYYQYIERAKELGMKSIGFSEHGSVFEWYHKKQAIEQAGLKYIHASEVYITETLDEKIRDNYHCILIAKNNDGRKEINRLISKSFNRTDNHYYYTPRLSIDDIINTSENIIITTACIGGILYKGNDEIKKKFIKFLIDNKHRCFLEIQHHQVDTQVKYNKFLYQIHLKTNIPLIAGTDTHALNEEHVAGRKKLQEGKNVFFEGEEGWDLAFKSLSELIEAYQKQGALPAEVYMEAIANTNVLADMVEEYEIDKSIKYPKLYSDSMKAYKQKIVQAIKEHPYICRRYKPNEILQMVNEELDVYEKTKSVDFMLLQKYLRDWERENGIYCGYGRGSVSGSQIAYILGITDMDSKKFGLNFFRFMNPSRITNADIDTDYSSKDRDRVKEFILKDKMNLPNIKTSEIITFNTIALKGAIKDIGRALGMPLTLTQQISDAVYIGDNKKFTIDDNWRKQYPELFKYVDIVNGVVVSIGSHPSGVLISDVDIEEEIGLCSLSSSPYPVSMLNMKELDELFFVKLDILGLDNLGVINDTCKLAGIERLTPDNVDLNDEKVWLSIRDDTTLIFQWESPSAQAYLKKFMSDETLEKVRSKVKNFSWIKWFSFGNGLIRPSCESFRDKVADGIFYDNGLEELDEFLAPTMGYLAMQEDIMQFLVKFCGYSDAESDNVRRGIAKKYGTENLLPEIEERFIRYTSENYGVSKEKCQEVIKPFLQVILDASAYSFSWNHSDAYSCIGYVCGYLRYYYPLEFLTSALNIFHDKEEKTVAITNYAKKVGIEILPIKFGSSRAEYSCDKDKNAIYKGIASIKYCNAQIAEELYELAQSKTYTNFVDLLQDIKEKTTVNARQLRILTTLNFFEAFGKNQKLLRIIDMFDELAHRKQINVKDIDKLRINVEILSRFSAKQTEKMFKDLDMIGYIKTIALRLKDKSLSVQEQVKSEIEYLGYTNYINEELQDDLYIVIEYKTYSDNTKPYVIVYRLNDGEIISTKVTAGTQFAFNPFKLYSVLKIIFKEANKRRLVNGEWVETEETQKIIDSWEVVKV